MKTSSLFFAACAACLIALTNLTAVRAQNAAPSASPAPKSPAAASSPTNDISHRLAEFYKWYMHVVNKNQFPLEGKPRTELKKYVTKRLLKEIDGVKNGPDGLDGDYFIDAQDWDKEWEQHIEVKNARASGAAGSAEVTLSGPNMKRHLRLRLLREENVWKVDKVSGVD